MRGVISNLILGGVPLLRYADDTLIMIDCREDYILNLKFLLYYFEWMSRLKINYHKSDIFVMGVEKEEAARVSNMLNYQLGHLPLTYLGITIGDRFIGWKSADNILNKLGKRLNNWRNNLFP